MTYSTFFQILHTDFFLIENLKTIKYVMGFNFIEITVIAKTIHLLTHLSISSLFQFTNEHFMTPF